MPRLNKMFVATLQKSPSKGGWIYVVIPDSVEFFGTRGHRPAPRTDRDLTRVYQHRSALRTRS